ncbi:MAG TPA: hypothetical protein PK156_28895, partial [Polyangium sp.]|nr:hypothetical protein [Polyangium sp.]
RLGPGERAQLEAGAMFSLSTSGTVYELRDASPPFAAALHRTTGKVHVATGGILVLPSEEQPRVTLFATSDGEWHVEIEKEVRPATNGEIVELAGNAYVLEVPVMPVGTLRSGETAPMLESIRLKFDVAPDEESVEITMFTGSKPTTLPPRRYHYLLLTLARAWLADAGMPASVRGFRDRDELCDKLGMDVMKLNVEIYRLRKQFAELGIQGAAGLIERRPGTYEVRIGVRDVEVGLG